MSEEVTVVSDTPVIDLQSTTVGVNWDEKQMDDLPYGRGIRGMARLLPGPLADAVRRRRQHGRRIDDHRRAQLRPQRRRS